VVNTEGNVMNSPDPWRVMQSSPPASTMVVPAPSWGHPFFGHGYPQGFAGGISPAWEQGFERGTSVFVGAEPPAHGPAIERRTGLTAEVAPVVAPATGGFTVHVELDDHQRLHAAICVDGKCYKTAIDLAPVIAAVMTKIAQYHIDLHKAMPSQTPVISGDVVVCSIDRAVGAAGDALIEALLDQHTRVACAGWLDDLGSAIKGAGVGLYQGVTETLQKYKGPITEAATQAAASYGGPAAGAAASQLVGPGIDSAANLGKDTPQKAAAEQQAQTDPLAAAALSAAKEVAAKTITAYYVTETAKQAAAGEPAAQQQISQVVQDAEKGDPVAHAVAPLVAHGFSTAIAARRPNSPESYQQVASHAVWRAHQQYQQRSGGVPALALGYLRLGRRQKVYLFHTPREAQGWYARLSPGQYSYAALFKTRNLGMPFAENFGTA
jgi:hypothetical protein